MKGGLHFLKGSLHFLKGGFNFLLKASNHDNTSTKASYSGYTVSYAHKKLDVLKPGAYMLHNTLLSLASSYE